MNPPPRFHLRVRFAESGKIRFVSHRDVARLFERAARKLRLPVAYSEGFSPRPKLSFGLALSVGHESDAEYLDVELYEPVDLEGLSERFTEALPDGLVVHDVAYKERGSDSLQQVITSCTWRIEVRGVPTTGVTAAVAEALAADELPIERLRKGKTTVADVRPAILALRVVGPSLDSSEQPTGDGTVLEADLSTESTSLRPSELVAALATVGRLEDLTEGRIRRKHQWMIVDGVRVEPLSHPDSSREESSTCPSRTRAKALPSTEPKEPLVAAQK